MYAACKRSLVWAETVGDRLRQAETVARVGLGATNGPWSVIPGSGWVVLAAIVLARIANS